MYDEDSQKKKKKTSTKEGYRRVNKQLLAELRKHGSTGRFGEAERAGGVLNLPWGEHARDSIKDEYQEEGQASPITVWAPAFLYICPASPVSVKYKGRNIVTSPNSKAKEGGSQMTCPRSSTDPVRRL